MQWLIVSVCVIVRVIVLECLQDSTTMVAPGLTSLVAPPGLAVSSISLEPHFLYSCELVVNKLKIGNINDWESSRTGGSIFVFTRPNEDSWKSLIGDTRSAASQEKESGSQASKPDSDARMAVRLSEQSSKIGCEMSTSHSILALLKALYAKN